MNNLANRDQIYSTTGLQRTLEQRGARRLRASVRGDMVPVTCDYWNRGICSSRSGATAKPCPSGRKPNGAHRLKPPSPNETASALLDQAILLLWGTCYQTGKRCPRDRSAHISGQWPNACRSASADRGVNQVSCSFSSWCDGAGGFYQRTHQVSGWKHSSSPLRLVTPETPDDCERQPRGGAMAMCARWIHCQKAERDSNLGTMDVLCTDKTGYS
jgi:hypothetical protein